MLAKWMFGSWAQGYLSGTNDFRARALKAEAKDLVLVPDLDTILAYLDKYCRENPLNNVADGSSALYIELSRAKRP